MYVREWRVPGREDGPRPLRRTADPGLHGSPEGPLPWFDDVEGQRRTMGDAAKVVKKSGKKRRSFFARNSLPVLGVAPSGHKIHELQLIAFHKSGVGINVVLVDEEGNPIE